MFLVSVGPGSWDDGKITDGVVQTSLSVRCFVVAWRWGHNLARLFQEVGFSPEVTDRFLTGGLRWRWLNEFFPHQKQLLKMSPKVRDSVVSYSAVSDRWNHFEDSCRNNVVNLAWVGVQLRVLNLFFCGVGWLDRIVPFLVFFVGSAATATLVIELGVWLRKPFPPFPCGVCGCSSEHWAATSKGHPSCLVPRHMAICQCAERHPTVGAKTWIHAVIFSKSTWIHDSCNSCGVFMTCGNCGSKYSKALPLIYSLVQVLKNEFGPTSISSSHSS